jgi:hypothetical protein
VKRKHGLPDEFEIKWGKISPAKVEFYRDVLDLFFATDWVQFRGLVVPDKGVLRHEAFDQTHDDWYYKMYYLLLKPMVLGDQRFRIYLDIKDTRGGAKVKALTAYLTSGAHDFAHEKITEIQQAHSNQIVGLQLADLIIGAIGYAHRKLSSSAAKGHLVSRLRELSGLSLLSTTVPRRPKFDVFVWEANQGEA